MTLEDFFTLSEMKNGLTTCARVEELIFAMQKQIRASNNAADAARQWSIAAGILASTQNKECLSLFVHSDGLSFLNYFLRNAVQCGREAADGEELINVLLESLGNLPVNLEKLNSSGIYEAVEKLFGHEDVNIGKKALMLFERWNTMGDVNDKCVGKWKLSSEDDSHISSPTMSGRIPNLDSDRKDPGSVKCPAPNKCFSAFSNDEPPSLASPPENGKYDQEDELSEEKCDSSSAVRILRCASMDAVWPECSKTFEVGSTDHDSANNLDAETAENYSDEASDEPPQCSEARNDAKIADGSDSELESGEMDALEIARQVAIEVEREVVDYREDLCSSSLEMSSNAAIEDDEQNHLKTSEANENEESVITPNQDDYEATSSPQQPEERATEFTKFLFDLNEDASMEDVDCAADSTCPNNPVNLSAPIPVPATSKGAPVPGFLITPLCFESGLGWKGSAATSAFRPASPRRTLNCERIDSVSKYKSNMIELDLNATDCENIFPDAPFPYSIPSWSSSSEKMKLDLNSNGEEEATPSDTLFLRRRFDLNDNLFLSKNEDDPVVRIPLERRPQANQLHQFHTAKGLSFDSNYTPHYTNVHQTRPPGFGYIAPGTIPNITDSRGGRNGVTLPFLMSLGGPPLSSGEPASLDLNFGIMPLPPAEANTGNSGSLLKRKEPDSSWEPYMFGYQHMASWRQ